MILWGLYVLLFLLGLGATLLALVGGSLGVVTRSAGSFGRRGRGAPEPRVTS